MKAKMILSLLIGMMPLNALRVFLYRKLMGYKIGEGTSIGPLNLFCVSEVEIGRNVKIGGLNLIKGPIRFEIGDNCWIGRSNTINASWSVADERFKDRAYGTVFKLGRDCVIQHNHYFDVYGRFLVGDRSWIVGRGSQFWTHGLSVTDRDIVIGDGNCITSAVRFAPGAQLGDENIVSMGAVVLSKINEDYKIISGYPAKAVKDIQEDKANGKYHFTMKDW